MTREEAKREMLFAKREVMADSYIDKAYNMAIKALEQPERKKGRWVRITQGAIPEKYMCPFCHRTIENDGVESLLSMRFPFCHCGADMREGEQNG